MLSPRIVVVKDPNHIDNLRLIRKSSKGVTKLPRVSEPLQHTCLTNSIFHTELGYQDPKLFKTSYYFIRSPVLNVLYHHNMGSLENGEQVCVQVGFDQGLRSAKVKRLPVILGQTISLTRKGMKRQLQTPPSVKSNIGSQKSFLQLFAEVLHGLPEGQRPKPIGL